MKKSSAGGAATNAGSDYQQRVSSVFLVCMLLDIDVSHIISTVSTGIPTEVSFETENPIDDCCINFNNGTQLYLQIKRNLNLSSKPNSDFYSVIDQFVRQYLCDDSEGNSYILATSSRSSSSITRTFRKITESIRFAGSSFNKIVFNEKEISVFTLLKEVLAKVYFARTGAEIKDDRLFPIIKRMHVQVLDIEHDEVLERAIITLIGVKSRANPILLWQSIISNALTYSSNRMIVSTDAFRKIYDKYISCSNTKTSSDNSILEADFLERKVLGELSCGRDVVLVEASGEKTDFVVMELYRFDEMCKHRIQYIDGYCILPNGIKAKVIRRFATFAGLTRYVEQNQADLHDKKITIIESNIDNEYENSHCVNLHRDYCRKLVSNNKTIQACLHCGNRINEQHGIMVEVDYIPHNHAIGIVHNRCLLPMDRIIGTVEVEFFRENKFLEGFDISTWFHAVIRGQAVLNGVEASNIKSGQVVTLLWNGRDAKRSGDFCIKVNLKNGDSRYATMRGKIARMDEAEALRQAISLSKSIADHKVRKDPFCYTSDLKSFGTYSFLLGAKGKGEKIIEASSAEVARYTKLLERTEETCDNFYSPLIYLTEENDILALINHVVLLSDPLQIPDFIDNWKIGGIEVTTDLSCHIIKSDSDFDEFVDSVLSQGLGLVIDPIVDQNFNLISGYIVKDIHALPGTGKGLGTGEQ